MMSSGNIQGLYQLEVFQTCLCYNLIRFLFHGSSMELKVDFLASQNFTLENLPSKLQICRALKFSL